MYVHQREVAETGGGWQGPEPLQEIFFQPLSL
jgi:hypothetical protein